MNAEAKVGMFVITCLVLLGVTVYYVGNEHWGTHLTPYRTYLRYAGGVGPGSEVLFGGIEVGRVKTVRAWNQDPTRIEILLEVKEGTPAQSEVDRTTRFRQSYEQPRNIDHHGLPGRPEAPAGQTIPSQETMSIDDMARKFSGIADNAEDLITQVRGELKGISGRTEVLLANLNEVTGSANRKQIAEILRQVNSLVATQSPKIDKITDQVVASDHRCGLGNQEGRPGRRPRGRDDYQRELDHRSTTRSHPPGSCGTAIDHAAGEELDHQSSSRGTVQ